MKTLSFFLLFFSAVISCYAQTITVTTTSTPSICYNDGTLTIIATGGTGPYTDSILSGPVNINLSYPVALPTGQNTFVDLPHGTFTIVVHDAAGHRTTVTANVGGSYQFPSLSVTSLGGLGFRGNASGGLAPLQFAISTTSSNSGFGPYQSSDTFLGVCPAQYWLRVRDSCGNIYTYPFYYSYTIQATAECVSFSRGQVNITVSNGHPPYTYSYSSNGNTTTNSTGNFTGLPTHSPGAYTVRDSCGVSASGSITSGSVQLQKHCPFDGNIYAPGPPAPGDTLTYVCTSCIPQQTYTYPNGQPFNDTLFRNLGSPTITVLVLSHGCGGDTLPTSFVTRNVTTPPHIKKTYISCRSFSCSLVDSSGAPVAADSFVLKYNNQRVTSNTTGLFMDLYIGSGSNVYEVDAYTGVGACLDTPSITVNLPVFNPVCDYLSENANCQPRWELRLAPQPSPEVFSLISYSPLDTTVFAPHMGNDYVYDLAPNSTFTLISDSGCSETIYTPYTNGGSVYSVTPCIGQPTIELAPDAYAYCSYNPHTSNTPQIEPVIIKLFHNNSLVLDTFSTSYGYIAIDTGWYYYSFYLKMDSSDPTQTYYDTICPIDTGSIYINGSHIPYPYSTIAYTGCDSLLNSPIHYQIFGGSTPYTVQIPGFDTVQLYSNTAIFPTRDTGTYNLIVYDNCGISRSFTFSIRDTCSTCGPVNAGNDTSICIGRSAHLTATPRHTGGTYLWSPGGATTQSITVSPSVTTPYIVTYTKLNCLPVTDTVNVIVVAASTLSVNDTSICAGRPASLYATPTPTGGTYLWTPGNYTTQSITVSPLATTTYSVTYSIAGCNAVSDTSHVIVSPAPTLSVRDTSVCAGRPASLYATPSQTGGSYLWTPGNYTTPTITVTPLTTTIYSVLYTLPGCNAVSYPERVTVSPAPILFVNDTIVCVGHQTSLYATTSLTGGTYLWTPGNFATQSITVSTQTDTAFSVTYTLSGCNNVTDTGRVTVIPEPTLSVNDTSICSGHSVSLLATPSQTGGTYLWTPGNYTTNIITVSPQTDTTYAVTYTLGGCDAVTDTSRVIVFPILTFSVNDTSVCKRRQATLHATPSQAGNTYLWTPGGYTTPSITISALSDTTYSVTVTDSNKCSSAATATITVNPLPTLSLGPDTIVCMGISYNIPGLTSASSIVWIPDSALSDPTIVAPKFFTNDSVNYTYTVIAMDVASGCADTGHLKIGTHTCVSYIDGPQAFSPNGDNVNDHYTLFSSQIASYVIRIYNRWGELVYESSDLSALNDLTKGWDGNYEGKPQPLGVFVYYILATDNFDKQISKKGNITLLR